MKKLCQIGEFGLIEALSKLAHPKKGLIKGIGDDAAVIELSSKKALVFTTDMLIEDVHFTRKMNSRLIGRKTLASSISDIAAMGARPKWAIVSLGVPKDLDVRVVKDIYKGMIALGSRFGVVLVGGDTVKSSKIILNVALLGETDKKDIVLRSGAKKNDLIFTTGPLGGSLESGRHLTFTPRLSESQFLVRNLKPSSMIDISDGLAGDLGHILKQSKVGAVLYEELIPRHAGCTLKQALYDGEDYELLFTLSIKNVRRLEKMKIKKFRFHFIGEITGEKDTLLLWEKKGRLKTIPAKSFQHF